MAETAASSLTKVYKTMWESPRGLLFEGGRALILTCF
jgi:hypothetical protein